MADNISIRFEHCPRCGEHKASIHAECDKCGLDINEFNEIEKEDAGSLLTVGGRGLGPGANRGEVFHAIKEGGDESVCGRLKGKGGQCYRDGVHWTKNVMDLAATEHWQTRPCAFCDNQGAFDDYKERYEE